MGRVLEATPVKLFCGLIANSPEAMERALHPLREKFGEVVLQSPIFPFDFTDYYEPEMGAGLLRCFVAFEGGRDPGTLAETKLETNGIEEMLAAKAEDGTLRRTVNIDPGYVAADKVVLATTKNRAHRVYLGKGIYAEVTLMFGKKTVRTFEWTYPDYRGAIAAEFFLQVRRSLLQEARNLRRKGSG
ncbi:MAG: DUF4416 family protein [Kiritimatiellae bacterium]|nr:DUF4416 family protein [Kiritimatiellia bacterium]